MICLIYVSTTTRAYTKSELANLQLQIQTRNRRFGITGLLLYQDRNVIQVLEGDKIIVNQLFETIKADPRHCGVIRLMERPIQQRQFTDWCMGFKDLNDPQVRQLPGYSEFMNLPLDSEAYRSNPARAYKLVDLFRRNMR